MASERGILTLLRQLLQLAVVGLAVGVACWPLNLVDRAQDALLHRLPAFGGTADALSPILLLAPLPVLPVLLLQARTWTRGAGSGIPQTLACLEAPARIDDLMAPAPTVQRLCLWSVASLALFPLGREGPVVHLGAAVVTALRRRFPRLLAGMTPADLLAVAGGAGLAAGFDTPLVGVVFVAEELTGRFTAALVWPAMVVAALAALVSNLGGQPEFALGILRFSPPEPSQFLWAVPFGLGGGLLGAVFGRLLLEASGHLGPLALRRPLPTGLALGAALALLAVLTGGASGGDGEAVMETLIHGDGIALATLPLLAARLLGPCLALGAGVPGGLIDPALSLGAVLGMALGGPLGIGPLALALAMAAALAGATQLPVLSLVFSLRLAGDQGLLPGVLLASVLGAYVSRALMALPIYHALAGSLTDPAGAADRAGGPASQI